MAAFAAALLAAGAATARAQAGAAAAVELSRTRAELIKATEDYKKSTEDFIALKQAEIERAEQKHAQLKELVAEGLVARRELEASEQALASLRSSLETLRAQVADSAHLIAEIEAAEEFAKSQAVVAAGAGNSFLKPTAKISPTAVVLRHTGAANWSVANLSGVQAFFASTFGRPLPLSAVGQTATHDRMGFNHRRAVDVPLHPDSAEGRALINYLHSQGITFIAFRAAVPGSATGPHIHIGPPSHRL